MLYKLKHRIKRYGPSEVLGTIGALGGAFLGLHLTGNEVVASFFGAWGENVGYYGYNVRQESREQTALGRRGIKKILGIIKDIITEFGFSEILDSFFVRPGMMYLATQYIDNYAAGLFVGKIIADIVFYIPTTYFYQQTLRRDINMLLDRIKEKVG